MAVVQGIKEKVHLPIYDCFTVKPREQLGDVPEASNTNVLKFFVNVQGKTKLQTNLQAASLLPHYNTFEARAMRVVISDLAPEFPEDLTVTDQGLPVVDDQDDVLDLSTPDATGTVGSASGGAAVAITADVKFGLSRVIDLLRIARESERKAAEVQFDEDAVTLKAGNFTLTDTQVLAARSIGEPLLFTVAQLEGFIGDISEKDRPPNEQLRPNDGAGTIIGKFIYNTVTSLFVGEKEMIRMPTWFFPGGAGPSSESASIVTHGLADPMATFRFAEPIFIDKQQNFRVELEIPDADVLREIKKIYGPLFMWLVLDGFMTRDVQ